MLRLAHRHNLGLVVAGVAEGVGRCERTEQRGEQILSGREERADSANARDWKARKRKGRE